MEIKRYNYAHQFSPDVDSLMRELRRMLLEGQYILGPAVESFESAFSGLLSVAHVCGVNSGTDALTIGLTALGVGPGDEVITQANTFYATVAAICHVGATPVLVDADERSFLIDTAAVADAITARTRVLLPVHLYGKPTPMKPLLRLAELRGLLVAEDAAQAVGARYDGVSAGSSGKIGCFSFHPSKNLAAAGDGGAIATNDSEVARQIRIRRELGQTRQNEHVVIGFNSKLDALQACILSWKLGEVEKWNAQRAAIASAYRERLADLPLAFQSTDPLEQHAYHLFQIRTRNRDALMTYLRAHGVDATVRYPVPIHLQPAFSRFGWRRGQFPVSERLAEELLCLPIRPDMGLGEVEEVVRLIRAFFGT